MVDGRGPPRLPDAVRAAGVLVLDAGRLGLAGARAARLHQEPRPPVGAGPRPDGAAVHVPAADADPHPLGQRQVAGRARPHQPGLDPPVATRPGSACAAPATWSGWRPRSATSSPRRGSPRASGRAWSPAATTWAAGSCTGTARRRGRHDGHGRPASSERRRLADAGRRAAFGPIRRRDPDTPRIWWTDTGVHQNLTFPVHPDPISGMHCWHQAVRVRPRRARRRARRHRRRHRQGPRGLPPLAGADPARRARVAGRHPPARAG